MVCWVLFSLALCKNRYIYFPIISHSIFTLEPIVFSEKIVSLIVCGIKEIVTVSSVRPNMVKLTPSTVIDPFKTNVFVNDGSIFKS